MPLLMGAKRRSDDGDGDGSADDSDQRTTIADGSAPQSPCAWKSVKRPRVQGDKTGHVHIVNDRSEGADKENAEPQVNKTRVPLDAFFGAPLAGIASKQRPQSSPAMPQRNSLVGVMKDTLLLADLEAQMARCQQSRSQSPFSPLWSSPVAPQASAPPSPPSPAPIPAQMPREPVSHSFTKPSEIALQFIYSLASLLILDSHAPPLHAEPPARPRALMLSPMSQLDVLSQISEMADRQAQEAATPTPSASSNSTSEDTGSSNREKHPVQQSCQHAWIPALNTGKKRPSESTAAQDAKNTKKTLAERTKKVATHQQVQLSEAITKDMLGWETCSEDMFLADSDCESGDDHWIFEDISDSDFE